MLIDYFRTQWSNNQTSQAVNFATNLRPTGIPFEWLLSLTKPRFYNKFIHDKLTFSLNVAFSLMFYFQTYIYFLEIKNYFKYFKFMFRLQYLPATTTPVSDVFGL